MSSPSERFAKYLYWKNNISVMVFCTKRAGIERGKTASVYFKIACIPTKKIAEALVKIIWDDGIIPYLYKKGPFYICTTDRIPGLKEASDSSSEDSDD